MTKTKTTTDTPKTDINHETTVEWLRPQFYLGKQIALVVDLVEWWASK